MNIKRPIESRNTDRLLRNVLPTDFEIVKNKNSNGYKYVNLLFGAEVDQLKDDMNKVYYNSSLETLDLKDSTDLYDVSIDGIPTGSYLNSKGLTPIKITNEYEFYNGNPTRLIYDDEIIIYNGSGINNIIGCEYFRQSSYGSGYYIITTNDDLASGYINDIYTTYKISVDRVGNITKTSGYFAGLNSQNFDTKDFDEVLTPPDSGALIKEYPLKRTIIDSNDVKHEIDHYEPYFGWTYNSDGEVVAINDYDGDFYYDENGEKTYYRTAFNNPFGYNNYNNIYLPLNTIPISGTLKVYDMDILDSSGNAIEIPQSGLTSYTLQSPMMNISNGKPGQSIDQIEYSGIFDPIYLGYDSVVPSGDKFGYISNSGANPYKTTSWDYVHQGSVYDEDLLQFVETGSGELTNMIKITNPISRYIVEYEYSDYKKAKYVSSFSATKFLSLDTEVPNYSITNNSNNIEEVQYKFTKDPLLDTPTDSERTRVLTFDGYDIRPNSNINKIVYDIPVRLTEVTNNDGILQRPELNKFMSVHTLYNSIGYSNEYVPVITDNRIYKLKCEFDSTLSGTLIETDISASGNNLSLVNSGNLIYETIYGNYVGKKIINTGNTSYFEMSGVNLFSEKTYHHCKFKSASPSGIIISEMYDVGNSEYMKIELSANKKINIYTNTHIASSIKTFDFNMLEKELIVRFKYDDLDSSVPDISVYYKDSNTFGFENVKTTLHNTTNTFDSSSSYLHIAKNSTMDIGYYGIYTEAF